MPVKIINNEVFITDDEKRCCNGCDNYTKCDEWGLCKPCAADNEF